MIIIKQMMKMKFAQAYIINTDTLCVYALLLKYIKCYSQNTWVCPKLLESPKLPRFTVLVRNDTLFVRNAYCAPIILLVRYMYCVPM